MTETKVAETDTYFIPKVLSPKQAARALGISKAHTYRMIQAGEVKVARLGKRILVPASEIARILGEVS